jgi:serine protease
MIAVGEQAFDEVVRPLFRPRVVFKLPGARSLDDAQALLDRLRLDPPPLARNLYEGDIRTFIRELAERVGRDVNVLFEWFTADAPPLISSGELAQRIAELDEDVRVHPDLPAADPAIDVAANPRFPEQTYLQAAPVGVGALPAWQKHDDADGRGMQVVDVEQGWTFDHEDLVGHQLQPPVTQRVVPLSRPHGTAVLGIVAAENNTRGCVGIAHGLERLGVVSHGGSLSNVATAVFEAASQLRCGDVLLLQVQTGEPVDDACHVPSGAPVELLPEMMTALQIITASGVTVVEAAGNGGHFLDELRDDVGVPILAEGGDDSGTIVVGAAQVDLNDPSNVTHAPHPSSCHGTRVNCFAWGDRVTTTWSTDWAGTDRYTGAFDGTSAAAAIVGGIAAVTQGACQERHGVRLNAGALRDRLSVGTQSEAGPNVIGVMPDLVAILDGLEAPPQGEEVCAPGP